MPKPHLATAALPLACVALICVCPANSSATHIAVYAQQVDARYTTEHRDAARKYLKEALYAKALGEAEAELKTMPDSAPALLLKSQALMGIYGEEYIILTKESRAACLQEIKATAERMEKYGVPNLAADDADEWREQLNILRGYIKYAWTGLPETPERKVFPPKEVATKARILTKPGVSYKGTRGVVMIRAILSAEGRVENLIVVRRLDPQTTREAVKSARKIKFVPAMMNGRSVSQYIQIEYNFLI